MKEFWQGITKFASLGIIVVLLYFGVDLAKNTNSVSWPGSGLIFVGITLAIFSFMDWRKIEGYECLIKQLNKVIKDLSTQINETKKTNVALEKHTRNSIDSTDPLFQKTEGKYIPDVDNGTQND